MDTIKLSTLILRKKGKFKLALNKRYNIVRLAGKDYRLKYLNSVQGSKGGNSSVFLMTSADQSDKDQETLVIKIANKANENSDQKYKRRFQREIIALERAKKNNKQYIIKHFRHGLVEWGELKFPFYTMEKGDSDLANFINENELNIDQKILLCLNVIKVFKELHGMELYHRDIKHDNILMFGDECKVCDLGLIRFKDDDMDFIESEKGERIGAFGWESPETMNKYLTEKLNTQFDCNIDSQSDVFQLGKLFWYIFQGNLPIGQVKFSDFVAGNQELFDIIFWMLQHGKTARPKSIEEVEEYLRMASRQYAVA